MFEPSYTEFVGFFPEFAVRTEPEINKHILYAHLVWDGEINIFISGQQQALLFYLLVAHNLQLDLESGGGANALGYVASASEGDVSTSFESRGKYNALSAWLMQTGYGSKFLAFVSSFAVGGFIAGGLCNEPNRV